MPTDGLIMGQPEDGSQKYYDKQSIAQISPNVVKVWDKGKLSQDAKDKIIEREEDIQPTR